MHTRLAPKKFLLALALLALGVLLVPASAPAATATFGANLARAADSTYTCTTVPSNLIAIPTTCSGQSTNLSTGESSFPPVGEGIVSAVRIRVGPTTGPMQIVVEQAIRQDNPFEAGKPNYACCAVVAMSQVFTPTANAITTVPVNLRVRQDLTPDANGYYVDQHLALSVLSPNVPIPAALDPNAFYGLWFPAWQTNGEQRTGLAGNSGLTILINADWDPVGTPPAPVTSTGAPSAVRAISIPNRQALVRNGRALIALSCGATDGACVGRMLLQNKRRAAATRPLLALRGKNGKKKGKGKKGAGKRSRLLPYGSVKFKIAAGKRRTVRVKLNRRGKRLLKKQGRPKVWAHVRMRGQSAPSRKITLKRAPRKHKRA